MRKNGLIKEEIELKLGKDLSQDCDFTSGFILGSMCTEPLKYSREIYSRYLQINAGDKGLSPCTATIEKHLILEIAELFHGRNIVGNFTSGGTEGNIIALRIARKYYSKIRNPNIIVSEAAHVSFDMLTDLIGVKIVKAKLTSHFILDVNDVRKKINKDTIGIVGIAGTTGLGLIDPISELGELAGEKELFLHVDAAFGGFIIPFMHELGYSIPKWDFAVESVNSIVSDPHKMGNGIIPAGMFLIRNDSSLEKLTFKVPYLAGGTFHHFNLTGTRPGAPIIALWATINYLGMEGYKNIVKECLQNTKYLKKRISDLKGVTIVTKPQLNVIGLKMEDDSDISLLNNQLKKKNWKVGEFKDLNFLRIVCMPHVKRAHLANFCEDLEFILKTKK